jgi:hypothetical protein
MNIDDRLRELVLHSLIDFKLIEDKLWRNFRWRQSNTDFLNFCLEKGHLSDSDFHEAVRTQILNYAKAMYKQTANRDNWVYADHVTSSHTLAYAIQQNHFTSGMVHFIRFDHDDTAETFMKGRVENLVENVMHQLRTMPDQVEAPAFDDHPMHNIII